MAVKKITLKKVSLKNVVIGDEKARVGFSVDRDDLALDDAGMVLCGSRCDAKIEMVDDPEQTSIIVDGQNVSHIEPFEAVVDIVSFAVRTKKISSGMVMVLSEIDKNKLTPFANSTAKLTLKRTGEIPDPVKEEADLLSNTEEEDDGWDEAVSKSRKQS